MEKAVEYTGVNPTDTLVTFEDIPLFIVRTDAPTNAITDDEFKEVVNRALSIHKGIKSKLETLIELDSYIQIGSKDNLIIADEKHRMSIIYPNGTFGKHSPLFYLDWLPEDTLLEVTEDETKLAKFIYKK